MLPTILLTVAPMAPVAPQGAPVDPHAEKAAAIPVLVVSGANNHDWKWTTPSLVTILEESGQFEVEVTYEPEKDMGSVEKLSSYGAVVLDYNGHRGQRWGEAAEAAFLEAVQGGLGVVVVHAADNHGKGWPEYEKLVGDLWRDGTGHGRFHTFNVDITDRDHPVTHSLPALIMHPDELYHRLVNVHGVERRVLATAYSDPETGGVGTNEPMILVKSYGQGRVFHTPLGHAWAGQVAQQASHRDPQFRGLISRGTEWAATGTVRDLRTAPAPLTDAEQAAGWVSLMDRDSWQSFSGSAAPAGWEFSEDAIVLKERSGDIITKELFEDFELIFDWKNTIAGNSGLKYRIPKGSESPIGPEFQLLGPWGDAESAKHKAGAIYDVMEAAEAPFTPWGEYRSARIVVQGTRMEHYIDGVLIASADEGSDDWTAAVAESKFAGVAGFAQPAPGHILLQDHGGEVWVRGMRIRSLEPRAAARDHSLTPGGSSTEPGKTLPLFPTDGSIDGWRPLGDAGYRISDGMLIGTAGPERKQSFLASEEIFGDFTLEVDLKIQVLGNSGIQLRSHIKENGRMAGYQAEIDPTERSWSGGIYDEGRRGWLNDLSANQAAREAFDLKGWNHYRILCDGPRIQTWVNGVPAADLLDSVDLSGRIAFQVHGGDDDIEMRWKNATIKRLGLHHWKEEGALESPANAGSFGESIGLRTKVRGDGAQLVLHFADGTKGEPISMKASKFWHDGGNNLVTILRSGTRTVVQMTDRTAYDLESKEAVAVEIIGAKGVEAWQRCLKEQ